jgi:TfoX/Sxy family transcriptional regulator of competence genes
MEVQPLFDEVADRLLAEDPELTPGRMFSAEGLKTAGRFFAMVSKGDLVVKLPEDRVDELVAAEGGAPFEVGARRMREWIRLRPESAEACASYVTEARDFVRGLVAASA